MEVIKTDLKKYLGETITILMNDGSHKRIKVLAVKSLGNTQTIAGPDDEGETIKIKSVDMAMVYPINGVL